MPILTGGLAVVFLRHAHVAAQFGIQIEVIEIEIQQVIEPGPAVRLATPGANDLRLVALVEVATARTTSLHKYVSFHERTSESMTRLDLTGPDAPRLPPFGLGL